MPKKTYEIDAYVTLTVNCTDLFVEAESVEEANKKAQELLEENNFCALEHTNFYSAERYGLCNPDGTIKDYQSVEGGWTLQSLTDIETQVTSFPLRHDGDEYQ
jgi:hypothetical protein